jgi:DNA (cytosine-5)-methyltransferase 1
MALKPKYFTFIDLFAGIGGLRIAFEKNGCHCVFSSEWDPSSQKTYAANFNETPHGDITKIKEEDIPEHDILTAGFPCQPFSSIGKRQGFSHPTQGTLFFDIVRILKHKKPSAFLLENVSGLINHNGGSTYAMIMDTLNTELGYHVEAEILDAADFGVPQYRKRIYIVGFKKDIAKKPSFKFSWPRKNTKKAAVGHFVETDLEGYSISKHLQRTYIYKKNDGRPQVITPESDFPVKTLCASYHKIQRLTGTFVRDGRTGLRLLSENECKAIMGFPKSFKIPVSRTQMYRQMGNSVAIPVVRKIAKNMVSALSKYKKR